MFSLVGTCSDMKRKKLLIFSAFPFTYFFCKFIIHKLWTHGEVLGSGKPNFIFSHLVFFWFLFKYHVMNNPSAIKLVHFGLEWAGNFLAGQFVTGNPGSAEMEGRPLPRYLVSKMPGYGIVQATWGWLPSRQALGCRARSPSTEALCYWLGISVRAISQGRYVSKKLQDGKSGASKHRL